MKRSLSVLTLLGALAAPAAAQHTGPAAPGAVRPRAADGTCETGPISYVFIDNHSIFDTTDPDLDPRFAWAYGVANALHVRTRASVIEREFLFEVGDCYDPFLLEESERLLRNNDFLARVDIYGLRQSDGSYHVVVDTNDEWSTQVDARVRLKDGLSFEGFDVTEKNLLGTGQTLGVFYRERDVRRDYGARFATPQLFGTRWDLRAAAGRTRAGTFVDQSVIYPFVGEVGRWGVLQRYRREDRFFDYIAGEDGGGTTHVLLPERAKSFDLALLTRRGRRGDQTVVGGALGFEALRYPGNVEVVRGDDFDDRGAADSLLVRQVGGQTQEINNVRMFVLVGQRNVWWVRRRGFDSMRGVQDVRLGSEIELAVGRTLAALRPRDDDLFADLTFQSGFELGRTLTALRFRGDVRRDLEASVGESEWQDVVAEGEALVYWRPSDAGRHTLLLRAAGAGGWHTRTPFQLTLGGDHAVRGYDDDRFPGARRVVFSLEERAYIGWPLRDVLDIGATAFVDVGRIWAGDVPFGQDSGWRASAGAGLRGSFPAGGRTTYRLDVAFPLGYGAGLGDARVIFSIGEVLGVSTPFADGQVQRSRVSGAERELITGGS